MALALIMTLNASSFLKLCIAKSKNLDPLETFSNYDELAVLHRIRSLISVLITAFMVAIYMNDWNPRVYYTLAEEHRALVDFLIGTSIISGVQIILILSCAFSHVLLKLWTLLEDKHCCWDFSCLGSTEIEATAMSSVVGGQYVDSGYCNSIGGLNLQNEEIPTTTRSRSKKLATYSAFLSPLLLFIVGIVSLVLSDIFRGGDIWIFILMSHFTLGMIVPIWLICTNGYLSIHVKRRICLVNNFVPEWLKTISVCLKLKPRSSQVGPCQP